jgi:acetylornithine deacetylase
MLICGPGDIQQAHRSDEWISIEQLAKGVEVYRRAFLSKELANMDG